MFRKHLGIPVCNSCEDLVTPQKNTDIQKKIKNEELPKKKWEIPSILPEFLESTGASLKSTREVLGNLCPLLGCVPIAHRATFTIPTGGVVTACAAECSVGYAAELAIRASGFGDLYTK